MSTALTSLTDPETSYLKSLVWLVVTQTLSLYEARILWDQILKGRGFPNHGELGYPPRYVTPDPEDRFTNEFADAWLAITGGKFEPELIHWVGLGPNLQAHDFLSSDETRWELYRKTDASGDDSSLWKIERSGNLLKPGLNPYNMTDLQIEVFHKLTIAIISRVYDVQKAADLWDAFMSGGNPDIPTFAVWDTSGLAEAAIAMLVHADYGGDWLPLLPLVEWLGPRETYKGLKAWNQALEDGYFPRVGLKNNLIGDVSVYTVAPWKSKVGSEPECLEPPTQVPGMNVRKQETVQDLVAEMEAVAKGIKDDHDIIVEKHKENLTLWKLLRFLAYEVTLGNFMFASEARQQLDAFIEGDPWIVEKYTRILHTPMVEPKVDPRALVYSALNILSSSVLIQDQELLLRQWKGPEVYEECHSRYVGENMTAPPDLAEDFMTPPWVWKKRMGYIAKEFAEEIPDVPETSESQVDLMEILKEDAREIALRTGTKRVRESLMVLLQRFWNHQYPSQDLGPVFHFLQSEMGQGVTSYLLGFSWSVIQDQVTDPEILAYGNMIAEECRIQGGVLVLDDVLNEILSPVFKSLDPVRIQLGDQLLEEEPVILSIGGSTQSSHS